MTPEPRLSDERRSNMRRWVLDYVDRRKRRRRRLAIAGAGVIGVAALSAAAWVVTAPQSVQERTVSCYSAASLDSTIAAGERYSGEAVGDPGEHALGMCAALWSAGVLGGSTPPSTGPTDAPVPELTLCVRADQTLAVFPTGDSGFCAANGLALYVKP
ncbi:hypothetical protein [Herbiconiux ginsengi]|uniref:Uncharacterized protein n=1 Tax=Herbiconiux ginsengi TaxID=381665 RepID=A0A1H3T411_9MICO|nr:hypothetical protein [Herbiconiux ginsengi]SDZ45073.1 hypothetical protein SAMN05216554_3980 [Herbiconiux ginsengi]